MNPFELRAFSQKIGDRMKAKRQAPTLAGRSVVYSWIVSYFVILLIPVVLSGFVYGIAKNTIESEINQANRHSLQNIQSGLDDTFRKVKIMASEISSNPGIQDAYQLTGLESTSYYTLYNAAKQLSNYKVMNESLQGYYLYLNDVDMVISPGAVDTASSFYQQHSDSRGYSYDQWHESMQQNHYGDYETIRYDSEEYDNQSSVAYIHSLPIPLFGGVSANLVVVFNFSNMLDSFVGKEQTILVLNSDNKILTQEGVSLPSSALSKVRLPNSQGVVTEKIGGRQVVISYITSSENSWKYATVTPVAVFWERAEFIRTVMMCGILFCMLFGGCLAYVFIRRNYSPVRSAVDFFRKKVAPEATWSRNEFSFLQEAFTSTVQEKEKIQNDLKKQNDALQGNLIESLLRGRRTTIPVTELMATTGIEFPYNQFWVMTIYIEEVDETLWGDPDGTYTDPVAMVHLVVSNVVEELLQRHSREYRVQVDEMMVFLINTDLPVPDFVAAISDNVREASEVLEQNFHVGLTFSVSACHGLQDIPDAYSEALSAMEYSRLTGKESLTFYSDAESETNGNFFYPTDQEHKLINFIQAGDAAAACSVLEDIFEKDLIRHYASLETSRFLMMNLTGSIIKSFGGSEAEELQKLLDSLKPIQQLMNGKRMADLKDDMRQIIQEICRYQESRGRQADDGIQKTVEALVRQHYSDPDFGIHRIAEAVGKSPYYASKIFKEQTGEGILDFISRVRIAEAKRMLKAGGANQQQIAHRVGFTNVRTFQRVFKKLEGVTPGQMEK